MILHLKRGVHIIQTSTLHDKYAWLKMSDLHRSNFCNLHKKSELDYWINQPRTMSPYHSNNVSDAESEQSVAISHKSPVRNTTRGSRSSQSDNLGMEIVTEEVCPSSPELKSKGSLCKDEKYNSSNELNRKSSEKKGFLRRIASLTRLSSKKTDDKTVAASLNLLY